MGAKEEAPHKRTNKRVSHPIAYKRDMDKIFGVGKEKLKQGGEPMLKMTKKTGIAPSNLDSLMERKNKFRKFNKVSGNSDASKEQ